MKISLNKGPEYLAATSLLAIFIIDIITPKEFIVDILYLSPIVMIFRQNKATIISFSLATSLLIIAPALFEHRGIHELSIWINRGISIFAIIIASYISLHYRNVSNQALKKQERYLRDLKEMLFMVSHQVRKPVANILGLIELMKSDEDLSEYGIKEYCINIKVSAVELDDFIKDLNKFINETEEQNRIGYKHI